VAGVMIVAGSVELVRSLLQLVVKLPGPTER
jgi:hypothetical protein